MDRHHSGGPPPVGVPPPPGSYSRGMTNSSSLAYPPPPPIISHHPEQNKENPKLEPLLIDYRLQQNQFLGARFIFECGMKKNIKNHKYIAYS